MLEIDRIDDGFSCASYIARMSVQSRPFIAHYQNKNLLDYFSFESLAKRVGGQVVRVTRSLNSEADSEIEFCQYLEYVLSLPEIDARLPFGEWKDIEHPWYLLRAADRSLVRGVSRGWLPEYFAFNILNMLPDESAGNELYTKDWLFMGPAGSISELHFDHHFVHTILVQCEGRKRLRLIADSDWDRVEVGDGRDNNSRWDGFGDVPDLLRGRVFEGVLEKGEFVFLPGGWYHCVQNLAPSSTYSYDFVDSVNGMRWLREAVADQIYQDFIVG